MLIGIIGESCTGKSTLAEKLKLRLGAEIFTGKDYLRLAKNETIAQKLFVKKLQAAISGDTVIYVISEKEHLALLPDGAIKILVCADLEVILDRFAQRMHGILPPPVKTMLERKHGIFDDVTHDYRIYNGVGAEEVCAALEERL